MPMTRLALLPALLLLLPRPARADMLGEQDSPCVRKNEGDDCDVDPLPSGFPGYRGTCVLPASKGWGRRRLLCKVPDLELTREQGGCWLYFKDGSDCVRPSGAQ